MEEGRINFKRGKWYVYRPGKDYVVFDSEEEAIEFLEPEEEWDTNTTFEET